MAGVFLPLLLWWVLNSLRFPWLFEAPSQFTGRQERKIVKVK